MRLRGGGLIGAVTTPSTAAAPGVWSMADVLAARKAGAWPESYGFINSEAATLVARFTTPPTNGRKALIDALVGSLKTAGVWAKLDVLWVLAAADSQAARLNWKEDRYNASPVSSPVFTADRGYTTDGSASYLASGFVPSTAGGQYTKDSAHASYWSRTSANTAGGHAGGARVSASSQQLFLPTRIAGDAALRRINQDVVGNNAPLADNSGHIAIRRSGPALLNAFRNATALAAADTTVSSGLPPFEVTLGGVNTAGTVGFFVAYQFSAFTIGASLSDTELSALFTALQTYLQAIGAA